MLPLHQFSKFSVFFPKQQALRLTHTPPAALAAEAVEVKGKGLVEAFLAIYLDGKAVAPDFREQIFKGVADSHRK